MLRYDIPRWSDSDMQAVENRHRNEIQHLRNNGTLRWFSLNCGSQMQPAFVYTEQEVPLPVATKHHILISSDGAATHPVQHTTLSSAEAEATRVAKKFPGQEITIYTAVKSFKVEDKPVTVKTFV